MKKVKQIIPEGCPRARIRATTRVSKRLADGTISETLGDESRGMVVPSAQLRERVFVILFAIAFAHGVNP